MKYCLDCKHFSPAHPYYPFDKCWHTEARDVIGRAGDPELTRALYGECGPDAKLYEPKPPAPTVTSKGQIFWRMRDLIFGRRASDNGGAGQ